MSARALSVWLVLLLALAFVASLMAGTVWLSPIDVFRGLASGQAQAQLPALIVMELRLPRAVLAVSIGAALGLSGAVLQGLTRNPLAEPGLLGVSSGAALGAVVALYFGLAKMFAPALPIMGMIGAIAASLLTFVLGWGGGTLALILAGAAVSGFFAAGIALALNLAPNPYAAFEIMTWLMGSLAERSWADVGLCAPFIVAGMALLSLTGAALDALSLGEAQAQSLGVNLHRLRLMALAGTALAVGAGTSIAGIIGFIGLVAPHLVRPFVGHQPSKILLHAALLGALLLLGADVATRLIRLGPEMRLGVFTSLLGTPFFFWLVVRLRKVAP